MSSLSQEPNSQSIRFFLFLYIMNTNFHYQNQEIRTLTDENEQTWFVATDVCKILGYAMPSNVVKDNLDDDERKLTNVRDGSGQRRTTWTINEYGLYSLILTSVRQYYCKLL